MDTRGGTDSGRHGRRCSCVACLSARAAAARARKRGELSPQTVPYTEIREHLRWLRSRGLGTPRIAQLSQVHRQTICDILYGRRRWIRLSTARRLQQVKPTRADGVFVPVWRARKLIEALEAEGYTRAQINAAAQVRSETFATQVRLSTMRSLEKAYRQLTS